MIDAQTLSTPLAAFVAGVVTSVHCVGMCGPLTCAAFGRSRGMGAPLSYQLSRFLSYSVVGGLLGWMGQQGASLFSSTLARLVPWAFAALFLAFAFGLEKRIPQPRFIARWMFRWKMASMRPTSLAAGLGFLTPLLPCGPLYLVFGVALLAGSFVSGAILMAGFAAGTIPLFFLGQTQFARIPVPVFQKLQRLLAFASALLLIWRGWHGIAGLEAPVSCCH